MKVVPDSAVTSVLARLRNEATALAVPFNQVLQFYAIERFLYRLSKSSYADGVLLKGALLLRTIGIPRARPTMDIDLLREGRADTEMLVQLVHDCATQQGAPDDVVFDPESIAAEEIAKDAKYQGTRIRIAARLGNVRLSVQIDFGVGDAVVPGPRLIEYPAFLKEPPVRLRAYPVEAAIAEKFQAIVELDAANSRMKDFYDIWMCSRHLEFDGATLSRAIAATFQRRSTPVPSTSPTAFTSAYYDAPLHQQQWKTFVLRIDEATLAGELTRVVRDLDQFLMPVAASTPPGLARRWPAGGPWLE